VNEKLNQSNIFKRLLFHLTFTIKDKRLQSGLESSLLDRLIFSRFNHMVLGGRVKALLCGGAVLSDDTQRFAQAALCTKVFQGYGLTETCAAGTIADEFDITTGRTGYPLVSCEIRLVNWDEGQYRTTDKPNPRGEVLIGGKVVAREYFGGEAAKENVNFKEIDGTRYFCTGDIGEIFPDGTLKIIGQ
jgi:long-chain acyl-CoA synthetase